MSALIAASFNDAIHAGTDSELMSASFQNSALPNTLELSAQNGQLSIDLNQTTRGVYLAGINIIVSFDRRGGDQSTGLGGVAVPDRIYYGSVSILAASAHATSLSYLDV